MANVQEIAERRRAQIARLKPKMVEHQESQNRLWDKKNGIVSAIEKNNEVKSNIGQIPGFFPTPQPLAERMVEAADLSNGLSILEPSAGAGAIAIEIRKAGIEPKCIEINWTLAEFLRNDGFETLCSDFLEHSQSYDRILMNPPFENGQDIDHVLHAYSLLNAGGIVVAIMGAGSFYRSDKKARHFQQWIKTHGYYEELEAGTFKSSGTMVNACFVVISKP